jgi:hypothetical protein
VEAGDDSVAIHKAGGHHVPVVEVISDRATYPSDFGYCIAVTEVGRDRITVVEADGDCITVVEVGGDLEAVCAAGLISALSTRSAVIVVLVTRLEVMKALS